VKAKPKLFKALIIVAAVLLTLGAVGATVAYIMDKTPPLENEFTPATVSCEVLENFDGVNKTDVLVKNTGNVKSYIRAVIVICWVSEADGSIYPEMPREGTDYSVTWGSAKWERAADGYYYYTSPTLAGESTDVLISSLNASDTAPDGYTLSVKIAATALQSEPKTTVESLWSVTVLDNGNLLVN